MTDPVHAKFEYANIDANTIAASPMWTSITSPASSPIAILFIQTSSAASFEISIDGMNPILLINPESNLGGLINIPTVINFKASNLFLPAGTVIYASHVAGVVGVTDRFTVTFIE